jgi:hypothetical protein
MNAQQFAADHLTELLARMQLSDTEQSIVWLAAQAGFLAGVKSVEVVGEKSND